MVPTNREGDAAASSSSSGAQSFLDDAARRSADQESIAEAVDQGRRLMVDLDRRMNQSREAMRAIEKLRTTASPPPRLLSSSSSINDGDDSFYSYRSPRVSAASHHHHRTGGREETQLGVGTTDQHAVLSMVAASQQYQRHRQGGAGSVRGGGERKMSQPPLVDTRQLWLLCSGGHFLLAPIAVANAVVREELKELSAAKEEAHATLKESVAELAHLEGPESALHRLHQGFQLTGSV